MGRTCSVHKEEDKYRALVGKLKRKGQLGRPRHRWEDGYMVLREKRWSGMGWTHLIQVRDQW
jgi:hypothetical protein